MCLTMNFPQCHLLFSGMALTPVGTGIVHSSLMCCEFLQATHFIFASLVSIIVSAINIRQVKELMGPG